MWTYMMAASRGERANSMMSSRRRNETESPKYGINLSRPMYRTTRLSGLSNTATTSFGSTYPYTTTQYGTGISHSNSGATAATIHTRSNVKDTQMFHTKMATKHRRHHHRNGNDEHCPTASEDIEDGTSLFSPLTPSATMTKDINLYNCKSSAVHGMVRKQLIANHTGDTTTNTAASTSSGHRSGVTSAAVLHLPTYDSDDDEISTSDGKYALHDHRINEDVGNSNSSDEDDEENIEMQEVENLESGIEKGKKMSKDQTTRSKPSAFRRTFNALRNRLTRRSRPKPPDWFLEKFSNTTNTDKIGKTEANTNPQGSSSNDDGLAFEIRGTSLLCNRLSVNTALESHYRWLAVVSLAVLYNLIFVVWRSVFWEVNNHATGLWYVLDYLCDFIYIVDILVHMHEGYLDQGLLVRDAYKLRRHYFSQKGWIIDFLSVFPTDLMYILWPPHSCNETFLPCPIIIRLNRLLRVPRMWEWFDRTETATSYPNVFRICKVVLAILVLIHWNACMYFAISYEIGFSTDNWVYNLNGTRNHTLHRQYIYSFYWSTLTLTTIGETPTPENDAEYLFVVADFLAGVLIFATIVGNIGSMISNMNVARVEFQNRMDGVKQYMAFRKVGHELEARVIRWFAYTWSQSGALDEERVLSALPDKLKAEIAIQVHMETLKQVRIFHDCEPGLLEALVLKLKLQVFSPGDYICRKGDVGKEMYIVKRGKLSVVADDGVTVFATLGAGSVFGEVSVLEIAGNRTGNRRTANVRSLGYSDLFCLAKRDLWETLADYPEARATLTERGCQLLRKDGLLDEEVFADSQRAPDPIEFGIEKLENSVENLSYRLARLLGEYAASQAKLKQRLAKLELNYQIKYSSITGLSDEPQTRGRSGRLYSLQPKRRTRPRPASAKRTGDIKQNTL